LNSGTYNQLTGELGTYDANAWVYLDNADWAAETGNLAAGGYGYEILLQASG
jgi:hypothetical protein